MAFFEPISVKRVVTADGTEPVTPEQLIEQLRAMRQHIPEFGPLPSVSAASLRRVAHVEDNFLQVGISAIGASPLVAAALGRDPNAVREERDEAARWAAFEQELRTTLEGVAAANLARRHRLGATALQAYTIARGLTRQQEHADLLPLVETMRQMNKFARKGARRRSPPADVDTPIPKA